MRDTFVNTLTELAIKDDNILLLTADLGFGVFDRFIKDCPDQFINIGVAEQNMMGIATGLALEGYKIFAYSIANFPTLRCLEQVRNDACYHNANVNIVASGGGFSYGALGMSHHATEDLSILRALPNITIVAPASADEARSATQAILDCPGVGYLRLDKTISKNNQGKDTPFKLGQARIAREGNDITIISTGGVLVEAEKAADILAKNNISCRLVNMHTIKPIDNNVILSAARETGGIITIEENNILGGLGGAVSEVCMEHGITPKFFTRIGLDDQYSEIVGSQQYLRDYYKINHERIVEIVKDLINK